MTAPILPLVIPLNLATHGCGLFPMPDIAKIPSFNASRLIPSRKRTRKTSLHRYGPRRLEVKLRPSRATA